MGKRCLCNNIDGKFPTEVKELALKAKVIMLISLHQDIRISGKSSQCFSVKIHKFKSQPRMVAHLPCKRAKLDLKGAVSIPERLKLYPKQMFLRTTAFPLSFLSSRSLFAFGTTRPSNLFWGHTVGIPTYLLCLTSFPSLSSSCFLPPSFPL